MRFRDKLHAYLRDQTPGPFLFVAILASAWGVLGRVTLDVWLVYSEFNDPSAALSKAIGSLPVWGLIAVLLWTPLTPRLRRCSFRDSLKTGVFVSIAGLILLYLIFVLRMEGISSVLKSGAGIGVFFPFFAITAIWMGGFFAIPVTIGTAVLFRFFLQLIDEKKEAA